MSKITNDGLTGQAQDAL